MSEQLGVRGRPSLQSIVKGVKDHLALLLGTLAFLWLVEIVDHLPFIELDHYGINPRSVSGLTGIVLAPFLHAGFWHLILNSLPFVVLGGFVLLGGMRAFLMVTAFVTLVGGMGVWLFAGAFTVHIGASGVIFGYLGFVLGRGLFERSLPWILVAALILFLYGGLLIGLLPAQRGVSWEGHFFGFVAGVVAARLMFAKPRGLTD